MAVSAAVRVMPWPPARVDSRNTKLLSGVPAWRGTDEIGRSTQLLAGVSVWQETDGIGQGIVRVMSWPPAHVCRNTKLLPGTPEI
eukprot:332216-Pelagomonas_calceolata.AAC.5